MIGDREGGPEKDRGRRGGGSKEGRREEEVGRGKERKRRITSL